MDGKATAVAQDLQEKLKKFLELACQSQNLHNILAGRQGVGALPRAWVLENIEAAAEPLVALNDGWEYLRLLELYEPLYAGLTRRLVERGLNSLSDEVHEAATDWQDKMESEARYLFNYRRDLLTDDEAQASRVVFFRKKSGSGPVGARMGQKAAQERTPATDVLLRDGVAVFRDRVRERILAEHGDAVLNRCPRCKGLCRTPRARQCPHCFHDWH